jgi:hypothetical protein
MKCDDEFQHEILVWKGAKRIAPSGPRTRRCLDLLTVEIYDGGRIVRAWCEPIQHHTLEASGTGRSKTSNMDGSTSVRSSWS